MKMRRTTLALCWTCVLGGAASLIAGCGGSIKHTATIPPLRGLKDPPRSTAPSIVAFASQRFRAAVPDLRVSATAVPSDGTNETVFRVSFVSHVTLGVSGHVDHDYRAVLLGPTARCSNFTEAAQGRADTRISMSLEPPIEYGWCRGTYRGTLVLDAKTYCPPPEHAGVPCGPLVSRSVAVGRFRFLVRGPQAAQPVVQAARPPRRGRLGR
jgi:hypothetical protein